MIPVMMEWTPYNCGLHCLAASVDVASGFRHTCALLLDGSVVCWGWNRNGLLGNNEDLGTYSCRPHRVEGLRSGEMSSRHGTRIYSRSPYPIVLVIIVNSPDT
jgi:hypothetical protein